jgi:hypothetical protein
MPTITMDTHQPIVQALDDKCDHGEISGMSGGGHCSTRRKTLQCHSVHHIT